MNIGTIVKIKATGQEPRDMMYAGWVGKIKNWATENGVTKYLVDSDAAGRLQAVSFVQWFPANELEEENA
jgi:hypothetical protein